MPPNLPRLLNRALSLTRCLVRLFSHSFSSAIIEIGQFNSHCFNLVSDIFTDQRFTLGFPIIAPFEDCFQSSGVRAWMTAYLSDAVGQGLDGSHQTRLCQMA